MPRTLPPSDAGRYCAAEAWAMWPLSTQKHPQSVAYWHRRNHRPGRNRGPHGPHLPLLSRYYVVVDQALPPGSVINGAQVPDGSILRGVPLAGPFFSRGSCRKAHRSLLKKRPDSQRLCVQEVLRAEGMRAPRIGPTVLVAPTDAPPGWWNVTAGQASATSESQHGQAPLAA